MLWLPKNVKCLFSFCRARMPLARVVSGQGFRAVVRGDSGNGAKPPKRHGGIRALQHAVGQSRGSRIMRDCMSPSDSTIANLNIPFYFGFATQVSQTRLRISDFEF